MKDDDTDAIAQGQRVLAGLVFRLGGKHTIVPASRNAHQILDKLHDTLKKIKKIDVVNSDTKTYTKSRLLSTSQLQQLSTRHQSKDDKMHTLFWTVSQNTMQCSARSGLLNA
jgi:hypothetical protein